MQLELFIQNGSAVYFPAAEEGVTLTLERKGVPGKLSFTVVQDEALQFSEGNAVKLTVDGTTVFYGFVFGKKRKAGTPAVEVTAYDQLRYLKNKDTVVAEGIKASDLLCRLAADFRLRLGEVEDTGYVLETCVEENVTLFDMLQNALDETLLHTGQLYCLYDDAGALTLKNINSMKLNLLLDEETAESYDYESGIDRETYTKIKLVYDNEETGRREAFVVQNGEKMNAWGVLQYFEEVQTSTGAAAKAEALMKLHGQPTRSLTVRGAAGDPRVRAGCAVAVSLRFDDVTLSRFLLAEKVVHHFDGGVHTMDLTLIGGEFIA